ncbi:hypothetical protein EV356DRAFT_565023 [Viridothelium virens]|uniref:Uncharacterized protein n=1 Tax=Viridothelium virens TaxID=1048519 RepID=A0A6A6HFK0_VIRVR|nr:hypothetical protein EV356DRAFT_565023 [Viridothelium virens]
MKKIYRKRGRPLEELRLWGSYQGLSLFLEWSAALDSASGKTEVVRLIVFVMHPQVFLHPWGQKHAYFFLCRPWTTKADFVKLVCGQQSQRLERAASEAVQAAKMRQKILASQRRQSNSRTVLSTARLRAILDHSGQLLADGAVDVDETGDYSYLPNEIREWLSDQQWTFFEGRTISTSNDLKDFHRRYCGEFARSDSSPTELIQDLLRMQRQHIRVQSSKAAVIDELTFYGFGERRVVQLKCSHCKKPLPDDDAARWATLDPNSYVRKKAPAHLCSGTGRYYAIPIKVSIPSCFPNRSTLQALRRPPRNDWQRCIRAPQRCENLPQTVESWCIGCREGTLLSDGSNKCVDFSPRWTAGSPPKYIERMPNCFKCDAGSRFIPIDAGIPSIGTQVLRHFAEEFGELSDGGLEAALSRRAPSRRTKRVVRSKETLT